MSAALNGDRLEGAHLAVCRSATSSLDSGHCFVHAIGIFKRNRAQLLDDTLVEPDQHLAGPAFEECAYPIGLQPCDGRCPAHRPEQLLMQCEEDLVGILARLALAIIPATAGRRLN